VTFIGIYQAHVYAVVQQTDDRAMGSGFLNFLAAFTAEWYDLIASTPGIRRMLARAWEESI
jgi:hypothetical protein